MHNSTAIDLHTIDIYEYTVCKKSNKYNKENTKDTNYTKKKQGPITIKTKRLLCLHTCLTNYFVF